MVNNNISSTDYFAPLSKYIHVRVVVDGVMDYAPWGFCCAKLILEWPHEPTTTRRHGASALRKYSNIHDIYEIQPGLHYEHFLGYWEYWGSRPWLFRVKWLHRSRDHSIRRGPFPRFVLYLYRFSRSRSRISHCIHLIDFYPRDAMLMLARVFATARCPSVRLSVRHESVLCQNEES